MNEDVDDMMKTNGYYRYWLAAAVGVLLAALAGCSGASSTRQEDLIAEEPIPPVLEGYVEWIPASKAKRAPDLTVQTLSHKKKTLRFGKYPRPTILFFWERHNYYCYHAAKFLQQLSDEFMTRRKPFRVIGIIMKTRKQDRLIRAFLRHEGIVYVNYLDNSSALKKMAGSKERAVIPSFFLIDRQGRIRMRKAGFKFVRAGFNEKGTGKQIIVYREDMPIERQFIPFNNKTLKMRKVRKRRIRDFLNRVLKER